MKKSQSFIFTSLYGCLMLLAMQNSYGEPFAGRPDVERFISAMVEKHGFDGDRLHTLFSRIEPQKSVIEAITRPAESKPWYEYRPIFVKRARIQGGAQFWSKNAETLDRAEARYGIPPEIIVAILGVETRYGRHTGRYRTVESLATLAFDYPPRGAFFRSELEELLLLARQEDIDPLSVKGSYAGAMGQAQFIPSSYRRYAVDFDGDGKRDLTGSAADAIGSIANYLSEHGWQPKAAIAARARVNGTAYRELLKKGLRPSIRIDQLGQYGVSVEGQLPDGEGTALVELETRAGPEYWVGLQNFYVITRYNHSPLYAMAVFQLSQKIRVTYMTADVRPKVMLH